MIKPKFTSVFASSPVKCIVGAESDKYLSLASFEELKNFIPDINPNNIDLLPISCDVCVVNRINKNGDIIDTDTALAMYKNFIHKMIDTEHNRNKVVGVIITASLSEFGTNKPLIEDDVKGKYLPFNITIGGVLWKAVNGDLCDLVEDSADPSSSNYLSVSSSWELGFSSFRVIELSVGEKNLVNPIEVPAEDIENIKKYLKCFGGSGVKDGKSYYRMPCQDVIPMGIGLTEKPAADVVGIATIVTANQDKIEAQADLLESNGKNGISQSNKIDVNKERITTMKINSIADITDENLKQCTASIISDFITSEIAKSSQEWAAKASEDKGNHQKLQDQHNELSKNVQEMRATIQSLQKEKEQREAVDKFNHRMNEVHAEYDMPSDVASVVAEQLKSCDASDEIFAKWKSAAGVLLKPYNRKDKEAQAKMTDGPKDGAKDQNDAKKSSTKSGSDNENYNANKDGNHELEAKMTDGPKDGSKDQNEQKKSSTKSGPEDDKETDKKAKAAIASAIDGAIDNADKEKGGLPNGTSAVSPNMLQKYGQAFAVENFIVT